MDDAGPLKEQSQRFMREADRRCAEERRTICLYCPSCCGPNVLTVCCRQCGCAGLSLLSGDCKLGKWTPGAITTNP